MTASSEGSRGGLSSPLIDAEEGRPTKNGGNGPPSRRQSEGQIGRAGAGGGEGPRKKKKLPKKRERPSRKSAPQLMPGENVDSFIKVFGFCIEMFGFWIEMFGF